MRDKNRSRADSSIRKTLLKKHSFPTTAVLLLPVLCTALFIAFGLSGASNPSEAGIDQTEPDASRLIHASENCFLANGGHFSYASDSPAASDTYPCHVCMQIQDPSTSISAYAVGNTVILRFRDSDLYSESLTGVFGMSFANPHYDSEAHSLLSNSLHGERYLAFLTDYSTYGRAEYISRKPYVLGIFPQSPAAQSDVHSAYMKYNRQKLLFSRFVGSAHYCVYYPDHPINDTVGIYWRIEGNELVMTNSGDMCTLTENFTLQTLESVLYASVRYINPESAYFNWAENGVEWKLYETDGFHILTAEEQNADKYLTDSVKLFFSGYEFPVNGYMDGETAVFSAILTAEEADMFKRSAKAEIRRVHFKDIAAQSPTAYTCVQYGNGGYGVIDKNGEFVIQPVWADAWQLNDSGPMVLADEIGNLTVLRSDTLAKIAYYSVDGKNSDAPEIKTEKYLSISYENPSVFTVRTGCGRYLCSMDHGRMLYKTEFDETGDFENGISYTASYTIKADESTERMVLEFYRTKAKEAPMDSVSGSVAMHMQLTDYSGTPVSSFYSRIVPLAWSNGRGLFLAEAFDSANVNEDRLTRFEEGSVSYSGTDFEPGWKCGLIDENGNEVVQIKYTKINYQDGIIVLSNDYGERSEVLLP